MKYWLLKTEPEEWSWQQQIKSGEKDVLGNIYKGPKQDLKEITYMVVKWEKVGHYALRLFWKDGHADGLYTFEMLRKLGEINEN